jgi:hypothetical protein
MKTLLKVLGAVVGCVVVLLVVLSITGFAPTGDTPGPNNKPGLWLKGNLVTTPVTDWSFTDQFQTVKLQTNTWYMIPHSVTTYCVAYQGQLYLTSVYPRGVKYPNGRNWNANVARDPHVRIRIGNQLYDRTLVLVTDPAQEAAILQVKAKKYPTQRVRPDATIIMFHVVDN